MTLMPWSTAAFKRADHLILVDRGRNDVVQIAARDHRIEERRLGLDAPGRRNLRDDVDAEVFGRLLHAELHHLIERIDDSGQEADLELLRGLARLRREGQTEPRRHCQ